MKKFIENFLKGFAITVGSIVAKEIYSKIKKSLN